MSDAEDLVKRARELAKLRDGASVGPYCTLRVQDFPVMRNQPFILIACVLEPVTVAAVEDIPGTDSKETAELLAAAPDMALLLDKMADALERATQALQDIKAQLEMTEWEESSDLAFGAIEHIAKRGLGEGER